MDKYKYKEYHFSFDTIDESNAFLGDVTPKNTCLVETKIYPLKYIGKKRYLYRRFPLNSNTFKGGSPSVKEDKIE